MALSAALNNAEMKYSQHGYSNTHTHTHALTLEFTCLALTGEMMRLKADLVLWVSR